MKIEGNSREGNRQVKTALRAQLRRQRAALSNSLRQQAAADLVQAAELPCLAAAGRVFAYYPIRGELDVLPLLSALHAQGKPLALPVTQADNHLIFYPWQPGQPLEQGRFAVPQPQGGQPVSPRAGDVFLIPGVGFDPAYNRLGQGAGCYDRFLAGLPAGVVLLGVGFGCQLADALPCQPTDQPMTGLWCGHLRQCRTLPGFAGCAGCALACPTPAGSRD